MINQSLVKEKGSANRFSLLSEYEAYFLIGGFRWPNSHPIKTSEVIMIARCYAKLGASVCLVVLAMLMGGCGVFDDSTVAYSGVHTKDGKFACAGFTGNLGYETTQCLVKLDRNASVIWEKTFSSSSTSLGRMYSAYKVLELEDGSLIFAALPLSLTKTSSDGNLLWTKQYGGSSPSEYVVALMRLRRANGGFALASEQTVFQIDEEGNEICRTSYPRAAIYAISETSDGGFVICGGPEPQFGGNECPESGAMFLSKLDANGTLLWTKDYISGAATDVIETQDHGFALAATSAEHVNNSWEGSYTANKMCLLRTDSEGNMLWIRYFGESGLNSKTSGKAILDSENGYILAGSIYSWPSTHMYVVHTDIDGNATSESEYSPFLLHAICSDMIRTTEGEIALIGSRLSMVWLGARLIEQAGAIFPPAVPWLKIINGD